MLAPRATLIDRSTDLMGHLGDMQVLLRVRLEGRVDEQRLARAAWLLTRAEPVLGCRFERRGWRAGWRLPDDLREADLVQVEATPDAQADAATFASFARPLDPTRDPLLRLHVARAPGGDTLGLTLSHHAADGGAVRQAGYRLADLYRRLGQDPGHVPEPHPGSRSLKQVARALGWRGPLRVLLRGWRDAWRNLVPLRSWAFPYQPGDPGPWTVSARTLGVDAVAAARSRGALLGATLNDVLLALYVRALAREARPPLTLPLRLMTTTDLRRYLPADAPLPVANLSGPAYVRLAGGQAALGAPGQGLDEMVRRVHADMAALKRDALALGQFPLGWLLFALLPHGLAGRAIGAMLRSPLRQALTPPAFTNTGVIEPEGLAGFGAPVAHASLHAPAFRPPYLLTSASGFQGTLTLSLGHAPAALPRDRAQAFLAGIEADIRG